MPGRSRGHHGATAGERAAKGGADEDGRNELETRRGLPLLEVAGRNLYVWSGNGRACPGDAPMNADLHTALERHHKLLASSTRCAQCSALWPCDASRALAALDAA